MANDISTVWIDSTFIPAEDALDGELDTPLEFLPAEADNIGERSIPIIYRAQEATPNDDLRVDITLEVPTTTVSGLLNVAEEYYMYPPPKLSGVEDSLVEYSKSEMNDEVFKNIYHIYSASYNSISGSLSKKIAFTVGNSRNMFDDTLHVYTSSATVSGLLDYIANYVNFSGNLNPSGIPIPFYDTTRHVEHEYTRASDILTPAGVNNIIDISFAGWIYHYIGFDAYSTLGGFNSGYPFEVTISGGGVDVHYLELYSTALTVSGLGMDVYCALTDFAELDFDVATISGAIDPQLYEVYSAGSDRKVLELDIELFPIKITNFFPDEGDYTTASGFISVDVLDDTCPVSTSGTYFKVDGIRVPVTFSGITDGYRMYYNPEESFSSLEGPTTFTAHAENECGQTLEKDYYLTFGYIVEYDNHPSSWQGIDYGFNNEVLVRVTAENYASCPQVSSLAWSFDSKEQFNNDLGASIVGKAFSYEYSDVSAEIYPQSLAYFYNREFEVILTAKDFAGNEMEPFILNYRIEDKPEN